MMTNEEDEKISLSFGVYKRFFLTYYGWSWLFCSQLAMCTVTGVTVLNDYLVGSWAYDKEQYARFSFYCPLTIGFAFIIALAVMGRAFANQGWTLIATRRLHRHMISRVLEAPINLYFDVTPVGRIMNKFSKDLNAIESSQGGMMSMLMRNFYQLVQVFVVAVFAVRWIGLILPLVLFVAFLLVKKAIPSIRETVRISSMTKSPLLSYLGETINGSSTIRAFDRSAEFIHGNNVLLNNNILSMQMQTGVQGWFAIRVDILAISLMLTIALVCILAREQAEPVLLSMLLVYMLQIQSTMAIFLRMFMMIQ